MKIKSLFIIVLFTGLILAQSAPTVTTTAASLITANSVSTGGNVTTDGGTGWVSQKGVCWGTTTNPTISGNHTVQGIGTGTFQSSIAALSGGTLYYIRAYATNSAGTAYGSNVTFTTLGNSDRMTGSADDILGKVGEGTNQALRTHDINSSKGISSITNYSDQPMTRVQGDSLNTLLQGILTAQTQINPQDSTSKKYLLTGDTTIICNPNGAYALTRFGWVDSLGTDSACVEVIRNGAWMKIPVKSLGDQQNYYTLIPSAQSGNLVITAGTKYTAWYSLYPNFFYLKYFRIRRLNAYTGATVGRSSYVEVRSEK